MKYLVSKNGEPVKDKEGKFLIFDYYTLALQSCLENNITDYQIELIDNKTD